MTPCASSTSSGPWPVLEVGRTYKDRAGRDVRILCIDAALVKNGNPTPVIGLVASASSGCEYLGYYGPNGGRTDLTSSEFDLILPRRYIALDDALSLIRQRTDRDGLANVATIIGDLETMPFKEINE